MNATSLPVSTSWRFDCQARGDADVNSKHTIQIRRRARLMAIQKSTVFELCFRRTNITAFQPCLRDSGAFRKRAAKHITNKTTVHITTQRVSLNSAEYGTSAKRLPQRLTTTSTSHRLFPIALLCLSKRGGLSDANAFHGPANCPSGGRNCPGVPLTILLSNCLVTSSNCASARSLTGVHASASIAHVVARCIMKTVSPHSSGRMPCSRQIC